MTQNQKFKLVYKISQVLKINPQRLVKLSLEQVFYVNLNLNKSTFLNACPGSGKTEVISLKFGYAVSKWKNTGVGIANLTFTTSAAKVLNQRIGEYLPTVTHPHFVGTFDSWLHSYILQPYCHTLINYAGIDGDKSIRIIEDDNNAAFLHAYTVKIKINESIRQFRATEYYFSIDWKEVHSHDENTHKALQQISNDDLITLRTNKIKFIEHGFATYTDAEILSIKVLNKYPDLVKKLSRRFPNIFIDECQDLSEQQITIIELLLNEGSSVHCVGDINQSIYKFRKVDPANFLAFSQKNKLSTFQLTSNFRSTQAIVDVCNALVSSEQKVIGHQSQLAINPILLWQYDDTNFRDLPLEFEKEIKKNGLELKESAILARGKNTIAELKNQGERSGFTKCELIAIALLTWKQPNRTTEVLKDALGYMGRAISLFAYGGSGDYKNQLCPKHIDTVAWRFLLKHLLDKAIIACPFEENNIDFLWPKWVASLKNYLEKNWDLLPKPINKFLDIKAKIKTPDNCTQTSVKTLCNFLPVHNLIRTATIHSVKGETLDAVLLISHPNAKSKGGHHSHWIAANAKDAEHVRFAFVACSRPKHLLILATPKLKTKEITDLAHLGFKLS